MGAVNTLLNSVAYMLGIRSRAAIMGLSFIGLLLVLTVLFIVPGVVLWSINALFPAAALELNFYTWCAVWFLIVIFRG